MLQKTADVKREHIERFCQELYRVLFEYDNNLSLGVIIGELEVAKNIMLKEHEQRLQYLKNNPQYSGQL